MSFPYSTKDSPSTNDDVDTLLQCGIKIMLKFVFSFLEQALKDGKRDLPLDFLREAVKLFAGINGSLLSTKDNVTITASLDQTYTFLHDLISRCELIK